MKIITGLLALIVAVATASAEVEIGKPAPDFTLRDSTGKELKLSDFKGKTVVLEWVNFGCPFIRKHYDSGNMQRLQKAAVAEGDVWLSINSSAPGKQGNFPPDQADAARKKEGSNATAYLLDSSGEVGALYDAKTTPDMYVINGDGILVYKGAIDNRPTPDPDSLAGATNYVEAALAATKAGQPVAIPTTKSYGCSVKY